MTQFGHFSTFALKFNDDSSVKSRHLPPTVQQLTSKSLESQFPAKKSVIH